MLVASRIESGEQVVAAVLPQIIGTIHTAIGCTTLRRAGVAIRVVVDDPVCQGDVIETAADGVIGIHLIDGTQFMLSHDTRAVLDQFVCDLDGVSHSVLLDVARGCFAFVAGRVARAGSLRIDTPVGSIRGRAHAGGFGMLSLTALTFATMSEVEAADPNETILDEDNIAYRDLEHGVLELWTKEPIPRHIIVEDPGETFELTKRGSSVIVSQVTNSAARMEELQAAQQAVLSNFAKGYGPGGSSTPNYLNQQLLQPINYTPPGGPTTQGSLSPIETAPIPVVDWPLPPPPPPEPPSLNAAIGPIEIDTEVFDTFPATTGTFTASSPRAGATLTYGISGGTTGDTVLNGAIYDVSKTGPYGTLYLNSRTGAYIFVPNSDAINALKTDTTQSFIIIVSDGTLSASETFTINIHGVDDAAIISGTTTGAVIEIHDVVNATPGTQTTTGTLTDTDPDDPANTFTAVSSPTKSAGGYGTFTMTASGTWTYTLDSTNSAVQALKVGGTLIDSFTVTSIDGTPKVVTITIHGPMIAVTGTAPSLTLSETHLTATVFDGNIAGSAPDATLTTTSGNFSTAFASVQGIDGATISYALSITGGNGTASGLIDSQTGQADVLVLNGNTIEGHVGTIDGTLAFTITVDPATGRVTFTEYRPVTQPSGTNPDGGEAASLAAGIVNLMATVTDKDGNFQTASFDLGSRLTLTDDGPTIAATGAAPSLTLSEAHLTATALDDNLAGSAPDATLTTTSGNFSTAFTSVQGADGATISYALSISGGNGTASGLIDSHTGQADVLVLNGNTIEGHVGSTSGALAFTITLDPATGRVTFTEYRPVTQPSGTSPDGGEGVSLTAGIVKLTATITDKDGDSQTASIDLGSRLTITDDGPTIGGFSHATIAAQDGQIANGTFDVSFGADGEGAMRVAVHNGTVNGYNLATTDLGGGITSVHVTGNGDDYTFYYTTHMVNGGVELNAFFTDTGGTLSDPFFTLLINPDGTYTFDVQGVGFLQQTTVSGSDFGASSSGQPSLTAPDGLLVITGDFNGAPADVKASNNGIAVGDTGLQMDQHETLLLSFTPEQTDVSFNLTQWQGNGTADIVFTVYDGATAIHEFNINIPKPSGDAHIVVKTTSNPALVNTYTFDAATSTYTLYVGSEFNQIGVSYDHVVTGNATFTVNNITYSEGPRIPSTELLFDVTAVDRDGDASTTSLQVDLVGSTSVASSLTSSSTPQLATTTVDTTADAAIVSGTTTSSVITPISSPTQSDKGFGTFATTAAGVWTLDNASQSGGDRLTGGYGDDVFVYLAAAASNSSQFDTITDFTSGSDKINLAAFGALAFMHLAAASTTVPPHTLAWIHDRANNETILYLNPTDQSLDIGNSALFEVHLQGISTVQASDFIYEPATTTVAAANEAIDPALAAIAAGDLIVLAASATVASSDWTVSDGTRWTLPAADESFSFHFAREGIESIGHARLASLGDIRAFVTDERDGDADFALANGSSIEPHHGLTTVPAAEDQVTSDPVPIHASAAASAPDDTAAKPSDLATDHAALIASTVAELHAEHAAVHESIHDPDPSQHGGPQRELHAAAETAHHNPHSESNPDDPGPDHPHTPGHVDVADAPTVHSKSEIAHSEHSESHDPHAAAEIAPHNPHSESNPDDPGPGQVHPSAVAQTDMQNPPEPGDTFHFKSEITHSEHREAVDLPEVAHGLASIVHDGDPAGPDGPAVASTDLSPEQPHGAEHAATAERHADHVAAVHAAHAAHDLIV